MDPEMITQILVTSPLYLDLQTGPQTTADVSL